MDVKGMRISACPATDRQRTRSRRPGLRSAAGRPWDSWTRRLIRLSGHRLPAYAFL
ncbi:TPA: hypothetical protein QHC21_000823 [Raoultella planticola]|uniref:hypothetical protein n=1 Tax=Raoultella TaxID=160674 RepID=UPI0027FF9D29|nr:hypothetical protein [Raoultella planticola]HDT6036766.1 hypothetical protein [Raoultella planticola]HDT6045650.1 hypothetical protein [Raoultella planticola]